VILDQALGLLKCEKQVYQLEAFVKHRVVEHCVALVVSGKDIDAFWAILLHDPFANVKAICLGCKKDR
jgi:hypothetical protein